MKFVFRLFIDGGGDRSGETLDGRAPIILDMVTIVMVTSQYFHACVLILIIKRVDKLALKGRIRTPPNG